MPDAILVSAVVADQHGETLRSIAPDRDLLVVGESMSAEQLAAVEIAYFSADCFPDGVTTFMRAAIRAANLAWLHTMSAGVDSPVFRTWIDRGVAITTSSGAAARPIAHTVMLYVLAHARNFDAFRDAQRQHRWERRANIDIEGQSMLVVGLGPIGIEVASLATAFGMSVTGLRRTPLPTDPCPSRPLADLPTIVGEFDLVVSALPLAAETSGIFSAAVIASMKRGAFFVNVGRGALVDEAALLDALVNGRLCGAGLDVFAQEPLPADSPFWDAPNTFITPHNSAAVPSIGRRATEIFLDNLRRHVAGEPKRNLAS